MDVLSSFAWIAWLALILIFIVVEMLTFGLVFLMLALGSVGGLLAGLVGVPWWGQLLIAAALAVLLLFAIRPPLLRALRRGDDPALSNVDALLGMNAQVVQTVTATNGQAKLANGEIWTARMAPGAGSESARPGDSVRVAAIDGATALVIPSAPFAPTEERR